jgi:hypothetical protein
LTGGWFGVAGAKLLSKTGVFLSMRLYSARVNANLTRIFVLTSVVVCGWMTASARVETTEEDPNPYAVISKMNVFRLNPPPPPVAAETAKPPDLQKVMLSGFQRVGQRLKVYLAIAAKDPKDVAYLALQTGEKERDVEIVKIRPEKQEVDIVNAGMKMTLSIASNGFVLGGGTPVAGAKTPGGPPAPGGIANRRMPIVPGMPPPPTAAAAPAPGGNSAIIVGGNNNEGSSYAGNAYVTGGNTAPAMSPGIDVPNSPAAQIANSLFNGTPVGAGNHVPQATGPAAPPEVQAAEMLVQHAAGGPPPPPTPDE